MQAFDWTRKMESHVLYVTLYFNMIYKHAWKNENALGLILVKKLYKSYAGGGASYAVCEGNLSSIHVY